MPLRFLVERPFVIAFDPQTGIVVRVLYEGQDFPMVFSGTGRRD